MRNLFHIFAVLSIQLNYAKCLCHLVLADFKVIASDCIVTDKMQSAQLLPL